jgi:segregation and condensation protein A
MEENQTERNKTGENQTDGKKTEDNILKMIIEKESWEEVLYNIVSLEQLDPWNVDLIKLTDSFLLYMSKIEELDFRIPAKIIFVSAVLLRLKADYLSIFEEEEEKFEEIAKQKPFENLGIDPNLIQLGLPMRRMPKRQVSLDELIVALRKAVGVRDRKVVRRTLWREQINAQFTEEDITNRIENVMKEIDSLMKKMREDKLKFSQIVEKWNRDQIIKHFIPLLHLEQNQQVKTEQEEFFKEIWISRRISQKEEDSSKG